MRLKLFAMFVIIGSAAAQAADKIQALDVKLGLWETTSKTSSTGMPTIPPEALANVPPEQRAAMMEMMKKRANLGNGTTTSRDCLTKEKLEKQMAFAEERKGCTRTVVTSTSSAMEMKIHCQHEGSESDGTIRVNVINSENVKGTFHMKAASADQASTASARPAMAAHVMNIDSTFTARWLGPTCGAEK